MKQLIKKILPKQLLSLYHLVWPFFGAVIYRHPSRRLKVIGVTGTNGKTTVTHLATHILKENGYKVASISSLRFVIRDHERNNKLKMTMPGRMKIQKFMREAVNAGCTHLVMEVTSEGVKQNRHRFIKFDTAVFTNLTKEHIENHGSFENYKKAKGRFFAVPHRVSVVNFDDKYSEYFLEFPATEKIGYTAKNILIADPSIKKIISAEELKAENSGTVFSIEGSKFNIPLLGEFNAYNAFAAIGACFAQGVHLKDAAKALRSFKGVPGRMEVVIDNPFTVVVDYAHTPDALLKVYKTLKGVEKTSEEAKMVCVLGSAGGGRDKWKRPEMGKLAAKYCDKIVLTDEDPYDEDPEKILDQVEEGILEQGPRGKSEISRILDRKEAIGEALKLAKKGDIVIITGKGAEPLMVTKKGPIPWDDREVVREKINN